MKLMLYAWSIFSILKNANIRPHGTSLAAGRDDQIANPLPANDESQYGLRRVNPCRSVRHGVAINMIDELFFRRMSTLI
jgi:hypothetical protein